jgi:hypothetical protein
VFGIVHPFFLAFLECSGTPRHSSNETAPVERIEASLARGRRYEYSK